MLCSDANTMQKDLPDRDGLKKTPKKKIIPKIKIALIGIT